MTHVVDQEAQIDIISVQPDAQRVVLNSWKVAAIRRPTPHWRARSLACLTTNDVPVVLECVIPGARLWRVLWVDRSGIVQLSRPGQVHPDAVRPRGYRCKVPLGPFWQYSRDSCARRRVEMDCERDT